jgi:hypothetical protein
LNDQTFAPFKDDTTGISLSRSKYSTIEEAAIGRPGKRYYVAVLNASDLMREGIEIKPTPDQPQGYDPAHVDLTGLKYADRKSDSTLELQRRLVELCVRVEGPFPTPEAGVNPHSAASPMPQS